MIDPVRQYQSSQEDGTSVICGDWSPLTSAIDQFLLKAQLFTSWADAPAQFRPSPDLLSCGEAGRASFLTSQRMCSDLENELFRFASEMNRLADEIAAHLEPDDAQALLLFTAAAKPLSPAKAIELWPPLRARLKSIALKLHAQSWKPWKVTPAPLPAATSPPAAPTVRTLQAAKGPIAAFLHLAGSIYTAETERAQQGRPRQPEQIRDDEIRLIAARDEALQAWETTRYAFDEVERRVNRLREAMVGLMMMERAEDEKGVARLFDEAAAAADAVYLLAVNPEEARDDRGQERAKGKQVPAPKLGPPQRYDPAADDAYLAEYAKRPDGQTAQEFEAQRNDPAGTVERTQARVRARPRFRLPK